MHVEDLDFHCSGMLWSFTLELGTDMLYNHGINSLRRVISTTAIRSPSITDVGIKYGKLSSTAKKKTGMTVTLIKVREDNIVYLSCFHKQFFNYVNILPMFNQFLFAY